MMYKIIVGVLLFSTVLSAKAQDINTIINAKEVEKMVGILSADDMEGRAIGTPSIEKAARYISAQFEAAGLKSWHPDSTGFRQTFTHTNRRRPALGSMELTNIVGILPGKSKKDEYVIFSGHYDHLGIGKGSSGDSIYNGANDDASGIAAVMLLAKYFKALGNNERTIVFAAFTAEESGGFGSQYFSRQFDSSKVMAMFNIEMIGTDSKWGNNSAYITGYEQTDMGKILEKNLHGTGFTFYPDPYPSQQLFYRSDNATLARQGVPAHTISTSKMDTEEHYHTVEDEIETLDVNNMAAIIRAIALSSKSIIQGKDTPSRVNTKGLR